MSNPIIAVYATARNEAQHVSRFLESVQQADLVVVTDTGSTDDTVAQLKAGGAVVCTATVRPWRFDVGFNCALSNVPENVDVCIKLDLDEVLVSPNWRDEITEAWRAGYTRMRYWYTWSWHVTGKVPAVRFVTDNIHLRDGYTWLHPGHTVLHSAHQDNVVTLKTTEIHHYMEAKDRPDYIPLLEQGVKENRCPRTLFYLGRELLGFRRYDDAQKVLQEYLDHPAATFMAQRADVLRMLAVIARHHRRYDEAISRLFQANSTRPGVRELWYELLVTFLEAKDAFGAYWAGRTCLGITQRDPAWLATNGDAWGDKSIALTAESLAALGQNGNATSVLRQGLQIFPESKLLQQLLAEYSR